MRKEKKLLGNTDINKETLRKHWENRNTDPSRYYDSEVYNCINVPTIIFSRNYVSEKSYTISITWSG